MTKTILEFESEVFDAVRGRIYIELPPILQERGIATIKLQFRIRPFPRGFIQFYYNEVNGKTSLALVIRDTRAYGYDYIPGKGWHRHIWPQGNRDYSVEGRKPTTVYNFMERIDEILTPITKT